MKQLSIPEPGKEYIEPNEAEDTKEITDAIIKRLERDYPPGKTLRQFHAKMHGCVKATFKVNADLPSNCSYGFLAPGKSYEAFIRFSNGNTKVVDDNKADLRGMAIKILHIDGPMLLQDHQLPQSQDLLLVSYPTLMAPNIAAFKKSIRALCNGTAGLIAFSLNPSNWPTIVRTLQSMKKTGSVFSLKYYSVSPYRLGRQDKAVKYAAFPVVQEVNQAGDKKDKNFLRERMKQQLSRGPVYFDFMVQFQEDAVKMPIENVCIEWTSPWHKVAQIEIPPQVFDTVDQNTFGENLTYAPWHCHTENQPLGGISRARRAAYEAIGKFRIERNQQ